jgi:hypothetical protein
VRGNSRRRSTFCNRVRYLFSYCVGVYPFTRFPPGSWVESGIHLPGILINRALRMAACEEKSKRSKIKLATGYRGPVKGALCPCRRCVSATCGRSTRTHHAAKIKLANRISVKCKMDLCSTCRRCVSAHRGDQVSTHENKTKLVSVFGEQ